METLKEYLETINKDKCPEECEFESKKEIEIALVPPPNEILGVVISRDPTTKWLEEYKRAKELPNDERRKKLFDTAIPKNLKKRVSKFIEEAAESTQLKYLFSVIDTKVYWTHLHKCFTNNIDRYKCTNSTRCADKWLKEELHLTMAHNNIKFIIALGKDTQEWLEGWKRNNEIDIEIIKLPHPSGYNNPVWYRSEKEKYKNRIEETQKEIEKLMKLI